MFCLPKTAWPPTSGSPRSTGAAGGAGTRGRGAKSVDPARTAGSEGIRQGRVRAIKGESRGIEGDQTPP